MMTIRDEALKWAWVSASLLLGLGLLAAPATSCTCTHIPTLEEAVQQSDAIFTGVVLEIEPGGEQYPGNVFIVMRSGSWWKGDVVETVRLLTGEGGAVCGYPFQVGKEYLVYAGLPSSQEYLWTSLCSRTHGTSPNDPDIAALGPPIAVATLARSWGSVRAAYR